MPPARQRPAAAASPSASRASEARFFDQFTVEKRDNLAAVPKGFRPKLRSMLKAKRRITAHFSESNFGEVTSPFTFGPYEFIYGYQRINLNHLDVYDAQPYFRLALDRQKDHAYFTFTSCGQAALSVSILTAMKLYGAKVLHRTAELYYETHEFLTDFGLGTERLSSKSRGQVLLLDSSTLESGFEPSWARFACVIIDTTCWSLGFTGLDRLVHRLLDAGADVILARSHIKLDCLGTEWSRLGSILFITQRPKERVGRFRQLFVKRSNPFGARAEIRQVYPFLKSKAFHRLNERWVAGLKRSNKALAANLAKQWARRWRYAPGSRLALVQQFPHDLFMWISVFEADPKQLDVRCLRLVAALEKAGLPAKHIASYPWDFFSLTTFIKSEQGSSPVPIGVFRISAPATTPAQRNRALKIIEAWVEAEFITEPASERQQRTALPPRAAK